MLSKRYNLNHKLSDVIDVRKCRHFVYLKVLFSYRQVAMWQRISSSIFDHDRQVAMILVTFSVHQMATELHIPTAGWRRPNHAIGQMV